MMNDGFCDKCCAFVGHADISIARTPIGSFGICSDCRNEIEDLTREEQKIFFEGLREGKDE